MKKLISIVTPTFNEEENIEELIERIKNTMNSISAEYEYEHIIIDNSSTDNTVELARELSQKNSRVKLIVNVRNFGPVRSPYYGLLSAKGDAVVLMASDLQDPPELLLEYIKKWQKGYEIVLAAKPQSDEFFVMRSVRKFFYRLLNAISDVPLENNATGAGLFDQKVIQCLRGISDPYPYFRGLICDLGFSRTTIEFRQPKRKRGLSKASFYGMLDQAFLAMTKHSKVPLRLMTIVGILFGVLALILSLVFLVLKLLFWNSFSLGVAPLIICFFFFASIQFFFLGILGEYVGIILTHVRRMPLVIERERINFFDDL